MEADGVRASGRRRGRRARPTLLLIGKALLTITLDPKEASPRAVTRKLELEDDELDQDFGVVEIDPQNHRYAVLVDENAASRIKGAAGVEGPFSNPRIEPFGPPQP